MRRPTRDSASRIASRGGAVSARCAFALLGDAVRVFARVLGDAGVADFFENVSAG